MSTMWYGGSLKSSRPPSKKRGVPPQPQASSKSVQILYHVIHPQQYNGHISPSFDASNIEKNIKKHPTVFSSNASPPGDRGRSAHRGNLSALVLRYPLPGKATKSHWANGHLWFLYDYGLVIFHIVMGVRLPKGSHLMWKLVVTSKCLCRLWRMIGKMRCDSLLFRLATRQISTDLDLVWSKSFFKEMPRVTESHPRKDQKPSCPMLYSWCPFWISQIKP